MTKKSAARKLIFEMPASSSSSSAKNVQPQENHMEKFIPADNDGNENSKEVLENNNSNEGMEQDIDHNNNGALVLVEQEEEKEEKDDDDNGDENNYHWQHPEIPNDVKSSRIMWSREDEVRLLKILFNFKEKNGHVKGSHVYLHVNQKFKNTFTVQQIGYKVKRIRKKYKLYKRKVETDGSDNGLDSYQMKIYDLCELIWNKKRVKLDKVFDLDCYINDITKDCNTRLMDKKILRKGFDILESSKKEGVMEKWAELRKAELEVSLKRSALLSEYLRLVREAFNSSP